MSKAAQNILSNCFKKTVKNVKDYIPPTAKTENIREGIPIKFPETFNTDYSPKMIPNVLYQEWPTDETINSFDFSNGGKKYLDPNSNLIIFPFSLRKETYSNMVWLRPEEAFEKKKLIELIKGKIQNKNFNFIKNKIELATKNFLNFEDMPKPPPELKEENEENQKTSIKNDTVEAEETEKPILSKLDNMEINIKRRNSIDIAIAEGHNSSFTKEFYNSKLTKESKKEVKKEKEKEKSDSDRSNDSDDEDAVKPKKSKPKKEESSDDD